MAAAKGITIQITAETTQATAALQNSSQQIDVLVRLSSTVITVRGVAESAVLIVQKSPALRCTGSSLSWVYQNAR